MDSYLGGGFRPDCPLLSGEPLLPWGGQISWFPWVETSGQNCKKINTNSIINGNKFFLILLTHSMDCEMVHMGLSTITRKVRCVTEKFHCHHNCELLTLNIL